MVFAVSCIFFLLCLLVFQKEYSNEEIEEEKAANHDENYEENHVAWAVLFFRSVVAPGNVYGLEHNVRPAFERRDNEKSHHCLADVVEIRVVS